MTLASRAIVGTAEKCCRNQINGAGHKIPPMTRRRGDQLSRQSMTKSWFRGEDAALPQCGRRSADPAVSSAKSAFPQHDLGAWRPGFPPL